MPHKQPFPNHPSAAPFGRLPGEIPVSGTNRRQARSAFQPPVVPERSGTGHSFLPCSSATILGTTLLYAHPPTHPLIHANSIHPHTHTAIVQIASPESWRNGPQTFDNVGLEYGRRRSCDNKFKQPRVKVLYYSPKGGRGFPAPARPRTRHARMHICVHVRTRECFLRRHSCLRVLRAYVLMSASVKTCGCAMWRVRMYLFVCALEWSLYLYIPLSLPSHFQVVVYSGCLSTAHAASCTVK